MDSKIIVSSAIIVGQNNFPFFVNIAPTTSVGPRDLRCTVEDEVRENLNRFSSSYLFCNASLVRGEAMLPPQYPFSFCVFASFLPHRWQSHLLLQWSMGEILFLKESKNGIQSRLSIIGCHYFCGNAIRRCFILPHIQAITSNSYF